jgi:hypothetical protein
LHVLITVELTKDFPEGAEIASRLKSVDVGKDIDGEAITSCVVMPAETQAKLETGPRLSKNQQTMFSILNSAGQSGLITEQWNEKARAVDIGVKRKADLYDIREALKCKGLIRQYGDRWNVAS